MSAKRIEEAEALVSVMRALEPVPTDERRCAVMAIVCIQLGEYGPAIDFIRQAQNHFMMREPAIPECGPAT